MKLRKLFVFMLFGCFLAVQQARASFDVLDCIADAPMYGYSSEADLNYGAHQTPRVKDYQGIPFMQFDFAGLQGYKAVACTLWVFTVVDFEWSSDIISTISVPWYEGNSVGVSEIGASTYLHRVYPDSLWAGPGSDARNVINGNNGSLVNSENLHFTEVPGWSSVVLDNELVQQLMDGKAYGIAIFGSSITQNRDIASRDWEGGSGAPYLELEFEEGEKVPPSAVTDLSLIDAIEHGKVRIGWTATGDDGAEGTASTYEFRYSEGSSFSWDSATGLGNAPTPETSGTSETWTITSLEPGKTYTLAVVVKDEALNSSGVSNTIEFTVPLDNTPPATISNLSATGGNGNGEILLSWTAPGDDGADGTAVSYEIRMSPAAITQSNWNIAEVVDHLLSPAEGGESQSLTISGLTPGQTYYFAIVTTDEVPLSSDVSNSASAVASTADYSLWVAPNYYKVNPRNGNAFEYDPDNYDVDGVPVPYKGKNRIWDSAQNKVSMLAGRNEFVGFQLIIEKEIEGTLANIEVSLDQRTGPMTIENKFNRLYRVWYNDFSHVLYPDMLIPFETAGGIYQVSPFSIPDSLSKDWNFGAVEQNNQAVYVDLYIPHDAVPGTYEYTLSVKADGVASKEVKVDVEVLNFELPDECNYYVDLNAYGSIEGGFRVGSSDTELADSLERVVQRMLHEHRAYLDIVPYGQSPSGTASSRMAPELNGQEGEALSVSSWTEYDKRYGPLFSGSAFVGNPRDGVPLPAYYLPFHTTWPVPAKPGQKVTEAQFSEQSYIDGFKSILAEFQQHIIDMGWDETKFKIYFNEKEQYGNTWDMDEPTKQTHYDALKFYGGLIHDVVTDDSEANIVFRLDIGHLSYLTGDLETYLDDSIDLWVINRSDYPEAKVRRLLSEGDESWTYGSAHRIYESMVSDFQTYFADYARGARGFVYWNTVSAWSSNDNAWYSTDDGGTNLLYPGQGGARNMIGHMAMPSLRLKVIRDVQEMMEMLIIMGNSTSYSREDSENKAKGYNTGILEDYVQAENDIKNVVDGLQGDAPEPPVVTGPVCDFNGDGNIAITDVIALMLAARTNPNDSKVDYNQDGNYGIIDAIAMLLDIINGTCSDQSSMLAGAGDPLDVSLMTGLNKDDIEYIMSRLDGMNLTEEEKAAFLVALFGTQGTPELPRSFALSQNTPNPFNPSTSISYQVPENNTGRVRITVFNIRGQVVNTLVDDVREPGTYTVQWDGKDNRGSNVGSGVYFYRMEADNFSKIRKMVLLK